MQSAVRKQVFIRGKWQLSSSEEVKKGLVELSNANLIRPPRHETRRTLPESLYLRNATRLRESNGTATKATIVTRFLKSS